MPKYLNLHLNQTNLIDFFLGLWRLKSWLISLILWSIHNTIHDVIAICVVGCTTNAHISICKHFHSIYRNGALNYLLGVHYCTSRVKCWNFNSSCLRGKNYLVLCNSDVLYCNVLDKLTPYCKNMGIVLVIPATLFLNFLFGWCSFSATAAVTFFRKSSNSWSPSWSNISLCCGPPVDSCMVIWVDAEI